MKRCDSLIAPDLFFDPLRWPAKRSPPLDFAEFVGSIVRYRDVSSSRRIFVRVMHVFVDACRKVGVEFSWVREAAEWLRRIARR